MDNFLFYGDFKKMIQADNLTQIIGGDLSVLSDTITNAVEECASNLRGKFDVSQALRPITKHDKSLTYKAGQTVYLDADNYEANKPYLLDSLTAYQSYVYKNTTAITTGEPFDPTHWVLVCAQYTIYNSISPQKTFNYKEFYNVGDQVFWKDSVFTCKIKTLVVGHEGQLQRGYMSDNVLNAFPDKSFERWGNGEPYSVPATTDITDTDFWQLGDARDAKLLQVCVDITLYHLHARISSRNVPELRETRYKGSPEDRETRGQRVLYPTYSALGWMQASVIGNDITPNLPLLQPNKESRISFGGKTKNENSY